MIISLLTFTVQSDTLTKLFKPCHLTNHHNPDEGREEVIELFINIIIIIIVIITMCSQELSFIREQQ